jgi:hypothetical protein
VKNVDLREALGWVIAMAERGADDPEDATEEGPFAGHYRLQQEALATVQGFLDGLMSQQVR